MKTHCVANQHFSNWEIILDHEITQRDRQILNDIQFKCAKSTNLQWFQYQILHHILPTRSLLAKIGYVKTIYVVYVNKVCETVDHLFWKCEKLTLTMLERGKCSHFP